MLNKIYLNPIEFQSENKPLYIFQQGNQLQFKYGASLQTINDILGDTCLTLFSNYFSKSVHAFRKINSDEIQTLNKCGHFEFFVTQTVNKPVGSILDFNFKNFTAEYGTKELLRGQFTVVQVPIAGLRIKTYLTKLMGSGVDRWEKVLQTDKDIGYNGFHFTPVSTLGFSDSAYSLKNHLDIDPRYGISWDEFDKFVKNKIRGDWKGFCFTDVVLNHVAFNSPFLKDHPEASYNLKNCPYLIPAFRIDAKLKSMSCENGVLNGLCINKNNSDIRYFMSQTFGTGEVYKNVMAGAEYELNKPGKNVVSEDNPISTNYFSVINSNSKPKFDWTTQNFDSDLELLIKTSPEFIQANNGWVMGWDSKQDFAAIPEIYETRKLICWGDSVKLNYGKKPSDSPALWKLMTKYVRKMASTFHGLRIDNCHSTPMHVAEFLLTEARKVNPELLIMLELFTGSEEQDAEFCRRLGASFLVRETLNHKNLRGMAEFLWKFGGKPIGSLNFNSGTSILDFCTLDSRLRVPPAIVYDMTHDNPSFWEVFGEKTQNYLIPLTALSSFCYAAFGSTRGHDELVKTHINVVTHKENYAIEQRRSSLSWAKLVLNEWKNEMCLFDEQFVDMISDHTCIVTRRCAEFNTFCYLVVSTVKTTVCLELLDPREKFSKIEFLGNCSFSAKGRSIELEPGSACLLKSEFPVIEMPKLPKFDKVDEQVDGLCKIDTNQLAKCLFSCEQEELHRSGRGMYDLPGYGKLKFAGIFGVIPLIKAIQKSNNLGHPLCENVRNGYWLVDYLRHHFVEIGASYYFDELCDIMESQPKCLRPSIFSEAMTELYVGIVNEILNRLKMDSSTSTPELLQLLAISSTQVVGHVDNVQLEKREQFPTFAAGLPHFAEGIWRQWGRDTFIALKGGLMLTNRLEEAEQLILAFGDKLKHGLIPNLYSCGGRYNARDAVWFWAEACKSFCEFKPEFKSLIKPKIIEIFKNHISGIKFVDAGEDDRMKKEGFEVTAGIDLETGLVYGGNSDNCGTWMDKMGNNGVPATPRSGSAIELTSLMFSVAKYFDIESELKIDLKPENFNKNFFNPNGKFYNDCVGITECRPNQFIGMQSCHEIFRNSRQAIITALESGMLGKLGFATLAPNDMSYDPWYEGGDNYHQGPEWVWICGSFLMCLINEFRGTDDWGVVKFLICQYLGNHLEHLYSSDWGGLPELTNKDGSFCARSCGTQAWSNSLFIEVLCELRKG